MCRRHYTEEENASDMKAILRVCIPFAIVCFTILYFAVRAIQ